MDTNTIVESLTQQRDRVVAAIEALTGATHRASTGVPRKRSKLSTAAKRKMSLAMKARWAKAKKSGKNALWSATRNKPSIMNDEDWLTVQELMEGRTETIEPNLMSLLVAPIAA